MVAQRVPIAHVAHALGHKHISTTMRCSHGDDESVRSAIDRLGDALHGLDDADGEAAAAS